MVQLQQRFGRLVAGQRRRMRLTQQALADASGLSIDMINRIETGRTGVSFRAIERLAAALKIDPAGLFSSQLAEKAAGSSPLEGILAQLSALKDSELAWVSRVLDAVLDQHGRAVGAAPADEERRSKKHRRGVSLE